MSLEEAIMALVTAIDANTDALQYHAATMREHGPTLGEMAQRAAPPAATGESAAAPKRGPGRPPKNPPPSPMEASQNASPVSSATPSPSPVAAPTPATASPASAPAAASGSDLPSSPDEQYEVLRGLVGQVGERLGRARVLQVFAHLGVPAGPDFKKPDHVAKMPHAIAMFREDLEKAK